MSMLRHTHHHVWLFAVAVCAVSTTACKSEQQQGETTQDEKRVNLVYVNWAEGIAMTNLARTILEDRMGYRVEMTMADVAPVYASLAGGDQDAFLDAWLPVTHGTYVEEYGDKLEDLGINYDEARIGLVVPEYVDITSVEQLNAQKKKFDGRIIGIDSGAGIMRATDKAIEAYKLDLQLIPSSGPAMTAALQDKIRKKEWIVVTGWKPHWMFSRWDLKFLDDPEKVYGETESIHTIARKGLPRDMPEVSMFLQRFRLNDEQLGGLMGMIAESEEDPLQVARRWAAQNEELVQSWVTEENSEQE